MDNCCNIETIQSNLNITEMLYQKKLKQTNYPCFLYKNKKKIYILKNLFSSYNVKKSEIFLNEHLKKIWYFFPSFWHIKRWFFFWLFNSLDLISTYNLEFLKKNLYYFVNDSNLLCIKNEYIFPISITLLSLYAGTVALICITRGKFTQTSSKLLDIYILAKKLKTKEGSFRSFFFGESDSRLSYCIFVILSLYNILTPEIAINCQKYMKNIQFNDGSFSENRFKEGHGAFFYCCIANLIFFSQKKKKSGLYNTCKYWINQRFKLFDFSIQGRTSKLTDCCYFFWIGATCILSSVSIKPNMINGIIFTKDEISGGFSDKIGRNLDLYHTCYALCGLSLLNFKKKSKHKNFETKEHNYFRVEQSFNNYKLNPVYAIRESNLINFLSK